jgi:hypothetical protein
MRFEIPKKFEVAGTEYKVVLVKKNGNRAGYCKWGQCEIEVTQTVDDVAMSDDYMKTSFFHELLHAVLNAAGEPEKRDDEAFVERVSGLLYQSIKTMK